MLITVKEAAELEGVWVSAIRNRICRRKLNARKDGRRRVMVRVADLSPKAQERYISMAHSNEFLQYDDYIDTERRLAKFPTRIRMEAMEWLHLLRTAPEKGIPQWLKDKRVGGRTITYRTFCRKRQAMQDAGIEALIDMRGRTKNDNIDEDTKVLIANLVLRDSQLTTTQIHQHLRTIKAGQKVPSIYQIRRFIRKEIPHAAKLLARKGTKAYEAEMPYIMRDYTTVEPGEIFCSDHTQLDVAIRHPQNGKPFFPWMTLTYDVRSRKIVSWWIDEKPCGRTIAASLRQALLYYSPPKTFMCDNGRDYSSRYLAGGQWRYRRHKVALDGETQGVLTSLGIRIHFTLPYRGRSKPVERVFKRIKEEMIRLLPGYRGGNLSERPEGLTKALKHTDKLLSLQDLRDNMGHYINFYNNSPHQGHAMDGRTPDQVFDAEGRQQYLVSPNTLTLLMMPAQSRLVYRNGIQFMGGWYYSVSLEPLRRERVQIRYDHQDLGRIAVFDTRGAFICWAVHQRRMSFKATQEELSDAMRREKTLRKSTQEYIKYTKGALGDDDLLQQIMSARRQGNNRPCTKRPQQKAARGLITGHDANAHEMAVSRQSDDARPRTSEKRKIWLPGEGYLEVEDD